ncbi:MAG: hypothetical protein KatS3mg110_1682 [Pirellulaceae bacterium]|nr:MAG: hypothetical protein KatS3mg110_1682 [Pirellulaceae bacterium]
MIKLLVSVRNAGEAEEALRGGADWLDIKEPAAGPLGAAGREVWWQVASVLEPGVPCSVALGELIDGQLPLEHIPPLCKFAKVGLARMADLDWSRQWIDVRRRLPPGTELAAVVYADWRAAGSPPPDAILHVAQQTGTRAVLFDTYGKKYSIFGCIEPRLLGRWIERVQRAGMLAVLAGSINQASLGVALALKPDLIAVRGAACEGGRLGCVSAARVARLAQLIRSARAAPAVFS